MREAGFKHISIRPRPESGEILKEFFPDLALSGVIASAVIEAIKE